MRVDLLGVQSIALDHACFHRFERSKATRRHWIIQYNVPATHQSALCHVVAIRHGRVDVAVDAPTPMARRAERYRHRLVKATLDKVQICQAELRDVLAQSRQIDILKSPALWRSMPRSVGGIPANVSKL